MPDLTAMAALLLSLGEAHQDLGEMCIELALHLAPQSTDIDVLALARAIQGEGANQFGDQREALGIWIAHTAYNRWEKPWWKKIDGVDCTFAARVEYDWHGTANVSEDDVEPWAIRIAQQVLEERRAGGIDQANGALFGMTLDDLREHGWADRARQMYVHGIVNPDELTTQFWFLIGWPGPKEEKP